jgi:Uma2 family endonuclease
MISTPVAPSPCISFDLPEKRVTFYDVSWQAYEAILAALGDKRSALLTYYKGTLEIMSPLEDHENPKEVIGDFIKILVDEGNFVGIKSMGSTTLNYPQLRVGAEPDQCYYIANEPQVRGKTVDLQIDPPPDLVLEVDITHTDIDKNALYAEMGVSEFWRYNGEVLTIYCLQSGVYKAVEVSPTFPWVTKEQLYEFIQACAQVGEKQAKRDFRDFIKQQLASQDS